MWQQVSRHLKAAPVAGWSLPLYYCTFRRTKLDHIIQPAKARPAYASAVTVRPIEIEMKPAE